MRFIPSDQLSIEWERVRAGLLEVQKNSVEDWLPEDVYISLKGNAAWLYLAEKEGDYLGFLILQVLPTFHGKRLHVWCAYSATGRPLMRTFLGALKELAAQAGCNKITFSSPRDEWLAVSERGGFKATQTTFELAL